MAQTMTVVRLYLTEADHGRRVTLVDEIFRLLHDQHRVRGVTVFRGIAGFGSAGEVHSADLFRLTANLPLVVEFFDAPEIAARAIESLRGMVDENHIIFWSAQCPTRAPSS